MSYAEFLQKKVGVKGNISWSEGSVIFTIGQNHPQDDTSTLVDVSNDYIVYEKRRFL